MYLQKLFYILAIFTIFLSCKDNNSDESSKANEQTSDMVVEKPKTVAIAENTPLYVWVEKLRFRSGPSTDTEVVGNLVEGDQLLFLNDRTDFTQKINLRGNLFNEPWLKVKSANGDTGWVYGAGVRVYNNKAASDTDQFSKLYVAVKNLRLRAEPDTKKEILADLVEGDSVTFLNNKTDFTNKISLRGTYWDEPWLEVKTSKGVTGWVYGGGITPYRPYIAAGPSPYDKCYELKKSGRTTAFDDCIAVAIQRQIRKDKDIVSKDGNDLILNLKSGETKTFTNKAETNLRFDYLYYLGSMNAFVVREKSDRGARVLLVNDKNGAIFPIWGLPKPSPDGRKMIVTKSDSGMANGVQIITRANNTFNAVFQKLTPGMEPYDPKWTDIKNVQVLLQPTKENTEARSTYLLLMENGDREWIELGAN